MKLTNIAFSAFLLSGSFLGAQDLLYGLQAGATLPQGDVKNNLHLTTGYSLGVNLLIDLGGGHAIVPRLDYTAFSGESFVVGVASTLSLPGGPPSITVPVSGKGKFTSTALIADYNFYVSGKANDGFYLALGTGYARNRHTLDLMTVPSIPPFYPSNYSETKGTFIFEAGVGYMFSTHFGAEAKYEITKYGDSSHSTNAPWLNLNLLARF